MVKNATLRKKRPQRAARRSAILNTLPEIAPLVSGSNGAYVTNVVDIVSENAALLSTRSLVALHATLRF
jgi:hypothetical protein